MESNFRATAGCLYVSFQNPSHQRGKFHEKTACFFTLIIASTLLVGCLIPERFSAKLDIQPDAGYTFRYSGTVVHALAAGQIKKAGSLSEKDENSLKSEVEKMSKSPEVKKVAYKGDGRYELELEAVRKAGQPLSMFSIFSVNTDKNGVMTIASKEVDEKGKRELEQLGITINGTFEVYIPKNVDIIFQNATSTPTFGFGSYSWDIGRIDQRPMMKIKFKP